MRKSLNEGIGVAFLSPRGGDGSESSLFVGQDSESDGSLFGGQYNDEDVYPFADQEDHVEYSGRPASELASNSNAQTPRPIARRRRPFKRKGIARRVKPPRGPAFPRTTIAEDNEFFNNLDDSTEDDQESSGMKVCRFKHNHRAGEQAVTNPLERRYRRHRVDPPVFIPEGQPGIVEDDHAHLVVKQRPPNQKRKAGEQVTKKDAETTAKRRRSPAVSAPVETALVDKRLQIEQSRQRPPVFVPVPSIWKRKRKSIAVESKRAAYRPAVALTPPSDERSCSHNSRAVEEPTITNKRLKGRILDTASFSPRSTPNGIDEIPPTPKSSSPVEQASVNKPLRVAESPRRPPPSIWIKKSKPLGLESQKAAYEPAEVLVPPSNERSGSHHSGSHHSRAAEERTLINKRAEGHIPDTPSFSRRSTTRRIDGTSIRPKSSSPSSSSSSSDAPLLPRKRLYQRTAASPCSMPGRDEGAQKDDDDALQQRSLALQRDTDVAVHSDAHGQAGEGRHTPKEQILGSLAPPTPTHSICSGDIGTASGKQADSTGVIMTVTELSDTDASPPTLDKEVAAILNKVLVLRPVHIAERDSSWNEAVKAMVRSVAADMLREWLIADAERERRGEGFATVELKREEMDARVASLSNLGQLVMDSYEANGRGEPEFTDGHMSQAREDALVGFQRAVNQMDRVVRPPACVDYNVVNEGWDSDVTACVREDDTSEEGLFV